jgi:hypothetical protein
MSLLEEIWRFIKYKIFRVDKMQDENSFNGRRVHVERAPEPTDVRWENLNIKRKARLKKICTTYTATAFILGGVFGINLALNLGKEALEDNANSGGTRS